MSRPEVLLICNDQLEAKLLMAAMKESNLAIRLIAQLDSSVQPITSALIILTSHDHHYQATVRELRLRSNAPLLLLTDYYSETSHITVLEEGVDLILFRPYSTRFLAAQIPALLRRLWPSGGMGAGGRRAGQNQHLSFDGIQLNSETQTLHFHHKPPLHLSRLEFRLLHKLMMHPRQVIPTEMLVEHVWGYDGEGDAEQIRKLVCRLRSKLRDNGREARLIHTVPHIGYSFRDLLDHVHFTPTQVGGTVGAVSSK